MYAEVRWYLNSVSLIGPADCSISQIAEEVLLLSRTSYSTHAGLQLRIVMNVHVGVYSIGRRALRICDTDL